MRESSIAEHLLYWISSSFVPVFLFTFIAFEAFDGEPELRRSAAITLYTLCWSPLLLLFGVTSLTALAANRVIPRARGSYSPCVRLGAERCMLPRCGRSKIVDADKDTLGVALMCEVFAATGFGIGLIVLVSVVQPEPNELLEPETFVLSGVHIIFALVKAWITPDFHFLEMFRKYGWRVVCGVQPIIMLLGILSAAPLAIPEQFFILLLVLVHSRAVPLEEPGAVKAPPRITKDGSYAIGSSKLEHLLFWTNALTSGVLAFFIGVDSGATRSEIVSAGVAFGFGLFLFVLDVTAVITLTAARDVYTSRDRQKRVPKILGIHSKYCGCCWFGAPTASETQKSLLMVLCLEAIVLIGLVVSLIVVETSEEGSFIATRPDILIIALLECILVVTKIFSGRKAVWGLIKRYNICILAVMAIQLPITIATTLAIFVFILPLEIYVLYKVLRYSPSYPTNPSDTDDTALEVMANLV